MTDFIYTQLSIVFASLACGYFLVMSVLTTLSNKNLRENEAIWHLLMCLFSLSYSILVLVTFIVPNTADLTLSLASIVGYLAVAFYIKAMTTFLRIDLKFLKIPLSFLMLISAFYFVDLVLFSIFDISIAYRLDDTSFIPSRFEKIIGITRPKSIVNDLITLPTAILIILGHLYLLRNIIKRSTKETALILGCIFSLIAIFNDILITAQDAVLLFPLYYLGNTIESFRFTYFYMRKSERKLIRVQQELRSKEMELEETKVSRHLLQLLSHDIANGIMLIELGLRKLQKESVQISEKVLKSLNRGLEIIKQTAENTKKYESLLVNKNNAELQEVSIGSLVMDSVNLSRESLESKNINLQLNIHDMNKIVETNSKLIVHSVFGNILSNAIKYSYEGGTINISSAEDSTFTLFSFQNTGPKIPEETLKSLITQLESPLKISSKTQSHPGSLGELGSGLGLLIANRIAHFLDGKISVTSSEVNKSEALTEFKVCLPK